MKRKLIKCYYIVAIILFILSTAYIINIYYDCFRSKKEAKSFNELSLLENNTTQEKVNTEQKTERMIKVETLQKQNPEVIGWIEIENTNIHYPVVQCSNNSYYLNHNYKKKYSVNGSIFLDKDYSWNPPSTNLLIYGHHSTFKDLLKYQKKEFYTQHPVIRFTTTKEDTLYEIIAVFQSKVYYQSEKNVFRYYYFINAENEEEYYSFIKNAKKASLYDTGKTAKYEEPLITLSTCSYHTKDGRFVIVAKKTS